MHRSVRSLLPLALVLSLLGCEGAQDQPDGGMDGGWDDRHDAGAPPAHDASDRFSDCVLGGDDCEPGERCAWGRVTPSGGFGLRCTDEPGTLEEGAACALDVAITFPDGARYDTSRCADDLVCAVGTGTTGTCVRPCHLLGCEEGLLCAGYWESCLPAVDCDPETHAPCAAGERCGAVTPLGAPVARWICVPTGDGAPGDACGADTDCARELGCLISGGGGVCSETCDPSDRPVPAGTDGGSALPDGGWTAPGRCEDGSLCVGHIDHDGTRTGLCMH